MPFFSYALNNVSKFSYNNLRCRVVVVAKLNNCRVPSSATLSIALVRNDNPSEIVLVQERQDEHFALKNARVIKTSHQLCNRREHLHIWRRGISGPIVSLCRSSFFFHSIHPSISHIILRKPSNYIPLTGTVPRPFIVITDLGHWPTGYNIVEFD